MATAVGSALATVTCSADSTDATVDLAWDVATQVKITAIQCSAANADVGAAVTFTVTQSTATIESLTETTIVAGAATTLNFVTTGLYANALGKRFFKIIASGSCGDQTDLSNAIAGGSGELAITSLTEGTYSATITTSQTIVGTGYKVCQSSASTGQAYAALTAAADTIDITVAAVVVASVDINTQVNGVSTTYTFTTSGGTLQDDEQQPTLYQSHGSWRCEYCRRCHRLEGWHYSGSGCPLRRYKRQPVIVHGGFAHKLWYRHWSSLLV